MADLSCDASTPLYKLDVVQVVLYTAQVGKAKRDKSSMTRPVKVLFLLNNLQQQVPADYAYAGPH